MIVNKAKVRVRNFFQKHKLLNAIYSLVSRSKNIILKPMSDPAFAGLNYRHNAGKILNLEAPVFLMKSCGG